MLKSAKYSVKEAKETDDGFVVKVAVQPMKCFENYEADLQKLQQKFLTDVRPNAERGKNTFRAGNYGTDGSNRV